MQCIYIYIYIYSAYGPTLYYSICLHYLLQYEILKHRRVVAEGCKIIVDLGKIHNKKKLKYWIVKKKFRNEKEVYRIDMLFTCVCLFVQLLLFELLTQILQLTVCNWKPPQ